MIEQFPHSSLNAEDLGLLAQHTERWGNQKSADARAVSGFHSNLS